MKMNIVLVFAGVILMSSMAHAMDSNQFQGMISNIKEKKFELVESFLSKNETLLRNDPEYYVVLLNYALSKGDHTSIVAAKGEPQGDDLTLKDKKTGETVGFLGRRGGYDEELILGGISKTQNALPSFKSRIDIRLGIVAAAEEIKRWDLVGDQLVDLLKISKEIDNKWTWGSINSMDDQPKNFMLENVQGSVSKLFNEGNPTADDALIRSSQAMIKYYPDVIYGYSNLGVLHLVKKEYDKSEEYLKKALIISRP